MNGTYRSFESYKCHSGWYQGFQEEEPSCCVATHRKNENRGARVGQTGSLPGFPERSHRSSQCKLPVRPTLSEEKNMRPKNIFTLLLLSLVCFGITAMAQENPFLGKWDITGVGPHSNYVYWLEVKEEDGKLTGSFLNRSGSVLPLEEIKIEGDYLI